MNSIKTYIISKEYSISPQEFDIDAWKYQLVIYRGFNHEGIPDKWEDDVLARGVNVNMQLKTFAITNSEYCAHCGLWYTEGVSAYVEPVVTIPEHRKKGLAKAVIYEACKRAQNLGAKRATVLSDQEFYYKIGFKCSSEFQFMRQPLDFGYGYIMEFYVKPEYRRRGYGRAMIARLEALFASHGVKRMYLTSDPVTRKPFWEELGFVNTNEKSPENNLYIYEKDVSKCL